MLKQFLVILFFIFSTAIYAHGDHDLGEINFPNSGNAPAQFYFKQGVMLLHSFEYDEARAAFIHAEQLDKHFALAYWGEAMTYNHTLWGEVDFQKGRDTLNKFAMNESAQIKKALPIEKGLMEAINLLYGRGDKTSRDIAYSNYMQKLYQENPDNDELATFYALSLFGITQAKRDVHYYMQAGGIANEVYMRHPQHPGALHYAIHAFDDPLHAPLGLPAARRYAKMASGASHALHMPSHIFFALGLWDEVILSNSSAWNAGLKQNPNSIARQYTIDDLHALQWLSYAYLQKRDFNKALSLTRQMEKIALEANTPMSKWYYALMRASYIIESEDYHSDLSTLDMREVELSARASNTYTDAILAWKKGDKAAVEKIILEMHAWLNQDKHEDSPANFFIAVTKNGLNATRIMLFELQSLVNADSLQQAVALENKMSFGYGPPIPPQPAYELLGFNYLKHNHPEKAYQLFSLSLERNPNRYQSLRGLNQARDNLSKLGKKIPVIIEPYFNRLMTPEFFH